MPPIDKPASHIADMKDRGLLFSLSSHFFGFFFLKASMNFGLGVLFIKDFIL